MPACLIRSRGDVRLQVVESNQSQDGVAEFGVFVFIDTTLPATGAAVH